MPDLSAFSSQRTSQDDGKLGWDRIKGQGFYLQINVAAVADVDVAAERIRAAGGTLIDEPADRPWGVRMFQFKDVDGFKMVVSTPLARSSTAIALSAWRPAQSGPGINLPAPGLIEAVRMICHGHRPDANCRVRRSGQLIEQVFPVHTGDRQMKLFGGLAIGVLALSVTACSSSTSPVSPSAASATAQSLSDASLDAKPGQALGAKPGNLTIVGIVLQNDGEFDVLQAAVIRAGLVDALNGTTQYTVFAPTDMAFRTTLGAADEAAAIAAVNGLPLEALTDILLYHVTNGRRNSTSVLAAPAYEMLNGKKLTRATLSAAGIAATDISASNGIVHVINAVLMP